MNTEDNYIHSKRDKAFNPRGFGRNFNEDQKQGRFSFDTIHGMKLKRVVYAVPAYDEYKASRAAFDGKRDENGKLVVQGVRSAFLKMLAKDHRAELVEKLGLTPREIKNMECGYTPKGLNVHHKLPLHGGGKNEFNNFILTPKCPHDQWHWDVLDPQLEGVDNGQSREVLLPWTDEMIYDPKKYGFTKENQTVLPNYTSNVNPDLYDKNYKAEHIDVAKRMAAEKAYWAAKSAQSTQQTVTRKPAAAVRFKFDRQRG